MPMFKSANHEKNYLAIMGAMVNIGSENKALAYLLSVDPVCLDHVTELYDFDSGCIRPQALQADWQTGTSLRTSKLAFNLFNGYCMADSETGSIHYTPFWLFDSDYAPYYAEAIKIRFRKSFEIENKNPFRKGD